MNKIKLRFMSLLLVAAFIVSPSVAYAAEQETSAQSISTYSPNYDYVDVAMYEENAPFTWRSNPEPIYLDMDCNSVTLHAKCADGETDELTANIVNKSNGHTTFLIFPANGSYTTVPLSFPSDLYTVYFTSEKNPESTKIYAFALFTHVNEGILSVSEVNARARDAINARVRSLNTPITK